VPDLTTSATPLTVRPGAVRVRCVDASTRAASAALVEKPARPSRMVTTTTDPSSTSPVAVDVTFARTRVSIAETSGHRGAVQTFLPYPDFAQSARALDPKRLGTQRVECIQVLRGLTVPTYGWRHHPAADFYGPKFPDLPDDLPYVWPAMQ
jgi:hypothetical protein